MDHSPFIQIRENNGPQPKLPYLVSHATRNTEIQRAVEGNLQTAKPCTTHPKQTKQLSVTITLRDKVSQFLGPFLHSKKPNYEIIEAHWTTCREKD